MSSFTKQNTKKDIGMFESYKKNHPVTPKEVINVFDLGYLGVEKDFPDKISSIQNRKEKPKRVGQGGKRVQPESLRKRIVMEHTICRMKKHDKRYLQKQVEKL